MDELNKKEIEAQALFMASLHKILGEHRAEIICYISCGAFNMVVEFEDQDVSDIDLGSFVNHKDYDGIYGRAEKKGIKRARELDKEKHPFTGTKPAGNHAFKDVKELGTADLNG